MLKKKSCEYNTLELINSNNNLYSAIPHEIGMSSQQQQQRNHNIYRKRTGTVFADDNTQIVHTEPSKHTHTHTITHTQTLVRTLKHTLDAHRRVQSQGSTFCTQLRTSKPTLKLRYFLLVRQFVQCVKSLICLRIKSMKLVALASH